MKFAYADPPYIGMANKYPEKEEVDHQELVRYLVAQFSDGWALSLHTPSLKQILSYCPDSVRVLAWVKPWASWRPMTNPVYAWEPVILYGGRKMEVKSDWQVRDWLACSTHGSSEKKTGVYGAKPPEFCEWILDCLGFRNGDEIVDLYPGSGIMSFTARQLRLEQPGPEQIELT